MSRDPLAEVADPDNAAPSTAGPVQADTAVPRTLALPSTLTISEVGELHAALLAALQDALPVEIDGSTVEAVDGAGLQLLAGFVKSADEVSLPVSWCSASERLRQAAAMVGLGHVLRLDSAARAS